MIFPKIVILPNTLAVLAWVGVFFPFLALFGILKFGASDLMTDLFEYRGYGSIGNFFVNLLPDFLQGWAVGFLSLYMAMNFLKKADTYAVGAAVGVLYLISALFIFTRTFDLPPDLHYFGLLSPYASLLGVLSGLAAFCLREHEIRRMAAGFKKSDEILS